MGSLLSQGIGYNPAEGKAQSASTLSGANKPICVWLIDK